MRALFLCPFSACPTRLDAQKNRHLHHPDHRRRSHRDRPGLRVRLLRNAGGEDVEGRGLPHRPGQFQPGDDHDRPGARGRNLYRADHARDRRQDHRERAPRHSRRLRAVADHGRADRAELRAVAAPAGHARQIRRRDDRRHGGRHRQGRRPPALPQRHGEDRPSDAEVAARQRLRLKEIRPRQIPRRSREAHRRGAGGIRTAMDARRKRAAQALSAAGACGGADGAVRNRPARDHPPLLHHGRHRRRHRLQQGRVHRHHRAGPGRLADQRSLD